MITICKREDLLAATTPPLPVYHLPDHHHYQDICGDDDLNVGDEPGKGGGQSELVVKRNSFNSQHVLRSNLVSQTGWKDHS